MYKRSFENYKVIDFISDESFINYHFYLNETDHVFWETWLLNNPSKRSQAREAGEMIQSLSLALPEQEFQAELKKIQEAINKPAPLRVFTNVGRDETVLLQPRKKRIVPYIFTALFILSAVISYLLITSKDKISSPLNQTISSGNRVLTFTLSDSTIVTLAANSALEYPLKFTGQNRQVNLKGEASFNVKRNEQLPFKVHTENIVTTVLGTVFNIKRPGDSAVVVELLKGKVKVEIDDTAAVYTRPILLSPDEKATYVFRDKHFYKNTTTATFDITFMHNSFEEIAARIKTLSGKTIVNKSSIKKWSFTGKFKNTTANLIVENICLTRKLTFKVVGDTFFINN